MIITIDTNNLTNDDKRLMTFLLEDTGFVVTDPVDALKIPNPDPVEDEVATKRKTRAKKADPAPSDVKDEAVQLATKLMSEQRNDVVKAALKSIDATRVSLLDEAQATAFIAAVKDLDD